MTIQIAISLHETCRPVPERPIQRVLRKIASDYGWEQGELSIAIVDDRAIRVVNRDHLQHDYATDVISFDLTESDEFLEGEIIVSITTADRESVHHGWPGDSELILYLIHGMLHIIGLGDKSSADRQAMREAERYYLKWMKVLGWESYANTL